MGEPATSDISKDKQVARSEGRQSEGMHPLQFARAHVRVAAGPTGRSRLCCAKSERLLAGHLLAVARELNLAAVFIHEPCGALPAEAHERRKAEDGLLVRQQPRLRDCICADTNCMSGLLSLEINRLRYHQTMYGTGMPIDSFATDGLLPFMVRSLHGNT